MINKKQEDKNIEKKLIYLYEYMDIVDPVSKLKEIERRAEKENKYSWELFINELLDNVIINDDIDVFINKIKNNLEISDKYYNNDNFIYINNIMLKINEENQKLFDNLQKITILKEINNCMARNNDFYNIQKNKIYQIMEIIKIVYIKMNDNQYNTKTNYLNNILMINYEKLKIRINIIKKINKNIKIISYEDNLLMNIITNDDIMPVYEDIKHNKVIYYNVILPKFVKIKEFHNKHYISCVNNSKINKSYFDGIKIVNTKNLKANLGNHKNIIPYNIVIHNHIYLLKRKENNFKLLYKLLKYRFINMIYIIYNTFINIPIVKMEDG